MKTSHEAQVEIRELLPVIRGVEEKMLRLFCETVGPRGLTGIQGDYSDINFAYQYLHSASRLIKAIGDHFNLSVKDQQSGT